MTEQQPGNEGQQERTDDADSAFQGSDGFASDTTSLRSSIREYVYENGRRYHSFHEGEYVLPNDEDEQDRLDLSNHVYGLLLGGELCRAPIVNPQRVLDLGTGTGIWAIDFADQHPESLVIGIDLSPIQPAWVPPNCKFEVDDYEQEWTFRQSFDFIHGRELEGSIRDHDKLFARCFKNLRPGGYLEMQSMEIATYSDDGSHHKAKNLQQFIDNLLKAAETFNKRMDSIPTWKDKMEKAGFKDINVKTYKAPQTIWPEDPDRKELSIYNQANALECLSAYSYALFSRVLGWSRVEIEVLLAGARAEFKSPSLRLYTKAHFIYGKKPDGN